MGKWRRLTNRRLAVLGGVPPYFFSLPISEQVASGIALSSAGTLSGTPGTPGTFAFDVTVVDHSDPQQTVQHQFTVKIIPGLSVPTNLVLSAGTPGQGYSDQVRVFSGTPPFSFVLASGPCHRGCS